MKTNKSRKFNIVIAQSGGPSMVINQSLVGAVLQARKSDSVGKILGARHGIDGVLKGDFIDLSKYSEAKLRAIASTPSSALGSCRHKPNESDCDDILAALLKRHIDCFFYIGGNDSADAARIIAERAALKGSSLQVIHIPKTIDNDLMGSDHTPGFGSAARFVACALMGDDLDNRALGGVKIDVIMGRDAGFLTASAALAKIRKDDGPHLIYLPERPFSTDKFVADVEGAMAKYGRCVIAVSEGIRDASGTPIAALFSGERDSHGNLQLSGTGALGDYLATLLKQRTGIKRVRADTFGYLQRSFAGIQSPVDAKEAFAVGTKAMRHALGRICSGKSAEAASVAIVRKSSPKYAVAFKICPIAAVAKNTRSMPDKFINASGNGVTQAFIKYAAPIVGPLPHCEIF